MTRMTREEQRKDDVETMRILFGADINELCNQGRHKDAKEMEDIRDRLIKALEQEPSKVKLKSRMCDDYCKWPTEWQGEGELAESDICKNCPLNYL